MTVKPFRQHVPRLLSAMCDTERADVFRSTTVSDDDPIYARVREFVQAHRLELVGRFPFDGENSDHFFVGCEFTVYLPRGITPKTAPPARRFHDKNFPDPHMN